MAELRLWPNHLMHQFLFLGHPNKKVLMKYMNISSQINTPRITLQNYGIEGNERQSWVECIMFIQVHEIFSIR